MSRSISTPFNYAFPAGTTAVSGHAISATAYNSANTDMANNVFNAAWPITYGGTGTVDGSSLVPDGNATTPSVRFQSEPTTGFYRVSAGVIGVSILGAQVGSFTATGQTSTLPITITGSSVGFTPLHLVSTDASAFSGPLAELYRDSASPAVNDLAGELIFYGRDSAANKQYYADLSVKLTNVTSTTESGAWRFATVQSGTAADRAYIGAGIYTANATSGDQGVDTVNASQYYINGAAFGRPVLGTAVATTSGTRTTMTGLPSTASCIRFMLAGVSTTGTDAKVIQIGSGSVTTSGYSGSNGFFGTSEAAGTSTAGLGIRSILAADTVSTIVEIALMDSATHTYVMTCTATANSNFVFGSAAYIALSGVLDRVSITTTGGTDTFDAGLVNWMAF